MSKSDEVIKRLWDKQETFRRYTVKITGNRKNKADGFYIMMLNQGFSSTEKDVFHGISKDTIELLKEADIKFEVVE